MEDAPKRERSFDGEDSRIACLPNSHRWVTRIIHAYMGCAVCQDQGTHGPPDSCRYGASRYFERERSLRNT